MTDLRTHHSRPARSRGRDDRGGRAPAAARMAGDQRPGRLRLRHGRRHADAPLPRHARSRRCPRRSGAWCCSITCSSACACRARASSGSAIEDEVAGPNAADRTEHLAEFRLELGLPVWLYRVDGFAIEKRIVMPHEQNTVHVTYRVLEGSGTVRFNLRPSVHFRGYGRCRRRIAGARSTRSRRRGQHYELSAGPDLPVLRMMLLGTRAALTLDEKGTPGVPYQMEETRGYQWKGSLWSPGYFRADADAGEQVSLIASAEPWDTVVALSPEGAAAAEHGAPAQAGRDRQRARGRHVRGGAGPGGRSVHHPSGGPRRGNRARARVRRRRADGDRRLSLVHGLGPRHDDQPRGADALDAPLPRGGLHPAHVRALRPRRPDPEHVPRRRSAKGCITRPTRRCGSSTRSSATPSRRETTRRCASCCRC